MKTESEKWWVKWGDKFLQNKVHGSIYYIVNPSTAVYGRFIFQKQTQVSYLLKIISWWRILA